jgi:hypothetical protein
LWGAERVFCREVQEVQEQESPLEEARVGPLNLYRFFLFRRNEIPPSFSDAAYSAYICLHDIESERAFYRSCKLL